MITSVCVPCATIYAGPSAAFTRKTYFSVMAPTMPGMKRGSWCWGRCTCLGKLPTATDCRLEVDEISDLQRLIKRRIDERVPTLYLLGEAWFCGLSFIVDDRVLIPRSPIAELIEERFAPWLADEPARILDLCTGSGCIGIACAEVFPDAEVALADLSYDALEVANQNIERHGMEDRVYTVQGDGFDGLPGQRFDLIVSNPPYVDAEDFADMPDEYQHEPELALACGSDGLNWSAACSPRPPII